MIIFLVLILLISITFHEYAHGWMAHRLGDPTPKDNGRLTLNPLAHIDPFGTVILPFILSLIGLFPLGYAKPVPINPNHFKNPKKDMMWVGIAGPAVNFIIAFSLILIFKMGIRVFPQGFIVAILVNIILGLLNLIPIPPLDGSRILAALLPGRLVYKYLRIESYGVLIVFSIIYLLVKMGLYQRFILSLLNLISYSLGIDIAM